MEALQVPKFISEITKLSQRRHLSFMERVVNRGTSYLLNPLGDKCPDNLRQAYLKLQTAMLEEFSTYNAQRKSPLTPQIESLDAERDVILSGIKSMLDALSKIGTDEQKTAALIVKKVFDGYKIRSKDSYEDEGIKIAQLCQEIESTDDVLAAVKTCKLSTHLTILKVQNAECRRLVNLRNEERSQKDGKTMTTARKTTDAAYNEFVNLLNAYSLTHSQDGVSMFNDCISIITADISYYKSWVMRRYSDSADNKRNPIEDKPLEDINLLNENLTAKQIDY